MPWHIWIPSHPDTFLTASFFSFASFSVVTQHTLCQSSKSLHTTWCIRLSTNVILEGFCPGLTQPGRTHCQEDSRPSRANVGPTGNLGLTHSKGCFPRGGSRFSATNKWIFLLSQKPHAATHSGHSPHQSQGQWHKRKSYEENGLRLCKKPRHIDMGAGSLAGAKPTFTTPIFPVVTQSQYEQERP